MDIVLTFIVVDFVFECLFDNFKKSNSFHINQDKLYIKFLIYLVNNYKEQIVAFIVIYITKSNSVTKLLADLVAFFSTI